MQRAYFSKWKDHNQRVNKIFLNKQTIKPENPNERYKRQPKSSLDDQKIIELLKSETSQENKNHTKN